MGKKIEEVNEKFSKRVQYLEKKLSILRGNYKDCKNPFASPVQVKLLTYDWNTPNKFARPILYYSQNEQVGMGRRRWYTTIIAGYDTT